MYLGKIIIIIFKGINFFLSYYFTFFLRMRGCSIGLRLIVKGLPVVDISHGAALKIGNNVLLNSQNLDYHVNMFAPVKLFADRSGATIKIGNNTRIHGSCIHAYELIEIGENCLIAANCQIFDGNGHDLSFDSPENRIKTKGLSKPIRIGDNVWLGTGVIILPGVTIGSGSVIAAGSVVRNSIPAMVVAAGNPAIIIKDYK